ncbi:trypsin-like serine protease [Haliea sp. E1-2-M8]|uniref:S1 family peptidase n=1 Tax=Haliea sp. E1-2-M8 TaxID=3064706 RepID=UPI0027175755|nr:trypsin-like serine protease [Haliea sp. E1-2-M8]MDO8864206.1 trypsin-like serine protease [Haliea sp. E1-2-M8]
MRFVLQTLLVVLSSLTFAGFANAVTWGEPDDGEHPAVGTLLFFDGNGVGLFSCTGTMISPWVMLTAAHCVETDGKPNAATFVRFDDNAVGDFSPPLLGWLSDKWIAADSVEAHPKWDDYATFPITYDIGVVVLSEPVSLSGYAEIPEVGFLAGLKGKDKQSFTTVGYGLQAFLGGPVQLQDPPVDAPVFYSADYVKQKGDVKLIELNSQFSGYGLSSARFSNNPGIGGGSCYGDSGGPTFFKDTNILVAVTSFGIAKNSYCMGNDFNYRTDTQEAAGFIEDMLKKYPL